MTKQTPPMRIDQRFTCPRICIYTTWSMIWRCIVLAAGVVHVRLISVSRSHELTCITTCHVIATEQTQPYTHTSNYKNRYLVSSYPSPASPVPFSYVRNVIFICYFAAIPFCSCNLMARIKSKAPQRRNCPEQTFSTGTLAANGSAHRRSRWGNQSPKQR